MTEHFSTVTYLNNINARAVDEHILFRMGYKKGITELTAEELKNIKGLMEEARRLCALKGAYGRYLITHNDYARVQLDNGVLFESRQLAELLKDSTEVVLMAATAGAEIVEAARNQIQSGSGAKGMIFDATASETADSALDWMQDFLNKKFEREGRITTRRFSPGYGDLQLSAQKHIYDSLLLEKIGVSITDRFLLLPEKSVLAIAGIQPVK
ncbi:MAG: methionine synthase [Candidatus Goldbacteria bacterium]|nr:methionine synthase [Candidatus Goldiibacteriota bacterium]